jgi:hypothetical protein
MEAAALCGVLGQGSNLRAAVRPPCVRNARSVPYSSAAMPRRRGTGTSQTAAPRSFLELCGLPWEQLEQPATVRSGAEGVLLCPVRPKPNRGGAPDVPCVELPSTSARRLARRGPRRARLATRTGYESWGIERDRERGRDQATGGRGGRDIDRALCIVRIAARPPGRAAAGRRLARRLCRLQRGLEMAQRGLPNAWGLLQQRGAPCWWFAVYIHAYIYMHNGSSDAPEAEETVVAGGWLKPRRHR